MNTEFRLLPRSHLPDIAWPAIPGPGAAALLAVLQQLETSQWWTPEKLREYQFRQLARLLRHARETVPWYRDRLDAVGSDNDAPLETGQWRRIPILSRSDVQAHHASLRTTALPPYHGGTADVMTSGSTGTPVTVRATGVAGFFWQVFTLRDHHWHRRDFAARHASIRYQPKDTATLPDGKQFPDWGLPVAAVYDSGPSALLNISSPVSGQAEWLQRQRPAYLLSYPSNLEALALYFRDQGLSLPGLREVRTVGESLGNGLRRLARDTWDTPLVDMYSTQEVGYIALQCPEHPHYHVQSENVYVEVVDESGNPCRPGETGRVLVTALHNFATPLIRYDIGDYAEVGNHCPCGRGLPVLQRIRGRVRNMLVLPGGGRCWPTWPTLSSTRYREVAPVLQCQIVQRDQVHIEVRLIVERPLSRLEEDGLGELILAGLGHPFSLEFTYPERIERSASGKFEDFVSHVASFTPSES